MRLCVTIILGFRSNPSSWPIFLQKTLNGAELAIESCFRKVGFFYIQMSDEILDIVLTIFGWLCLTFAWFHY